MADLDIIVNTESVRRANAELEQLGVTAGKTEQATSKFAQSTTQSLGQAANQAESLAQRIEKALNIKPAGMDMGRAADIEAYGRELDRLRQKYVPLAAAEAAHARSLNEIKQAQAVGAISMREMTAAIDRETIAFNNLTAAQKRQQQTQAAGMPGAPGGAGAGGMGMQRMMQTNMMYQLQDVAVTAAMGMSPAMIALQQGTQIGATISAAGGLKEGLGGIVGALKSMLSLSNILPIAIIGIGAAFYQWVTGAGEKVKTLDETTKDYVKTLDDLAKAYGTTASAAQMAAAGTPEGIMTARAEAARQLQQVRTTESGKKLFGMEGSWTDMLTLPSGPLGGLVSPPRVGEPVFAAAEKFKPFESALKELYEGLKAGAPDFDKFDKQILAVAASSDEAAKALPKLVEETDEARKAFALMGVSIEEMIAQADKLQKLRFAREDATTDQQRLKAVRDLAEAQNEYGKTLAQRAAIERAVAEEQHKIDTENEKFRHDQIRSIDTIINKEKFELSIMNENATVQEVLRQKYDAITEVKKQMLLVDPAGEEYKKYELLLRLLEAFFGTLQKVKNEELAINQAREAARTDASIQSMNARTNAERIAAAGQQAAAGVAGGGAFERGEAERVEAARIEKEMTDATEQRHLALDKLVLSQQRQIELIGKTAGEQAALNEQYRLEDEYREDMRRRGLPVQEAELELIRAKTKAHGELLDVLNKEKLQQDIMFERSLLYMSQEERTIAQRLRGTGLSTTGPEAEALRFNIREEERLDFARGVGKDFLSSMSDAIVEGGDDMGEALIKALVGSAQRTLDKVLDRLFDNILDAILGQGKGAGGDSLVSQLVDAFFGGAGKGGGGGGGGKSVVDTVSEQVVKVVGDSITGGGGQSVLTGGVGGDDLTKAVSTSITDWLKYSNQGAGRNLPLSPKLAETLGSFVPQMGLGVDVFSGGIHPSHRLPGTSVRHDWGGAADIFLTKDGRRLNWANPADLPIFKEFVSRGKEAGLTGFGAGPGYMREGSMHVGFGTEAVWGKGGAGAAAPGWLREAASGKSFDRSVKSVEKFSDTLDKASVSTDKLADAATTSTDKLLETADKAATPAAKALENVADAGTNATQGLTSVTQGLGSFGSQLSNWLSNLGGGGGGGGGWWADLLGIFGASSAPTGAVTSSLASGWTTRLHSGNMGSSSVSSLSDLRSWINAPRLHNGFAADEFPAVLRRGEPVFPSMAAAKGALGGGTIVNVHNYSGAPIKTQTEENGQGTTLDIIVDRMVAGQIDQRGTASNNAIRGKFAVSERLRMR